jgi:hypothetical protein
MYHIGMALVIIHYKMKNRKYHTFGTIPKSNREWQNQYPYHTNTWRGQSAYPDIALYYSNYCVYWIEDTQNINFSRNRETLTETGTLSMWPSLFHDTDWVADIDRSKNRVFTGATSLYTVFGPVYISINRN